MRSIVITGASSGIGAALARRAASSGWAVLGVARRAERLETLVREIRERGGTAEIFMADVLADADTAINRRARGARLWSHRCGGE